MKTLISRKTILLSLLLTLGLLSVSCVLLRSKAEKVPDAPTQEPVLQPTFDESRLGKANRDVVYCTADDGTELLMDVYYPEFNDGPWPVMLFVHGGGWSSGSKDEFYLSDFTNLGILSVSINYRLSPEVKFPAHIEDVKCAVRYLRANAEYYNLDPDRILAAGGSAGGHLVSLLGTTGDSGEFNTGQYLEYSSAVQAVIALSAPTDLGNWICDDPQHVESYYLYVFDSTAKCGETDDKIAAASPVTYVSSEDVPFLILAGTADEVVPFQQSEILHQALLDAGISSQLFLVEGGDHGLSVEGHPEREEEVLWTMIDFVLEQLELDEPAWLDEERNQ